ncbi:MAG TPA: alpha/beta hydrolase [Acidobacteriaceae bacterium]|jgi:acetyl esterase/lipase
MLTKLVLAVIGAVVIIGAGVYAAFELSPWPSVLLIRHSFDKGGAEAAASIAPLVPEGVSAQRDLSYAPGDPDALFDVFAPTNAQATLPAVVWVHGGGFVAGSRADLSSYLQILAARGFVEARFPTPVRQTNAALSHIIANAGRFNIDPQRIFVAGDSAGAQIAAQTALIISDADYARQMRIEAGMKRPALRGLVLFCGPYDASLLNFEGPFAAFMRTVLWSYLGTRNPRDARVADLSVAPHVTAAYPPVFISVGNADPLAPQSVALAEALRVRGVEVDTLFFPKDHDPPLDHEYQLLLSTDAGRLAFDRSVAFLNAHAK